MGCCVPKLGSSADVITPVISVHNVYNSSHFTCLYALCSVYPCSNHCALLSTPTPQHIALKLVFPSPLSPPPPHLHLPIPTSSCVSAILPYYLVLLCHTSSCGSAVLPFPHLHTLCFCTMPSPPLLVVLLSCHITSHTSTPCASAPCHPHLFLWFCCPAILLLVLLHHAIPTSSCGSAVLPYYLVLLHHAIPTSSCGSAVLPYYFPHLHTLCFCTMPSPPLLVVLLSCHITSHTSTPCASAPSHPHLFLWFCCPAILLPTPPHPVLLHHPIPTSSCGSAVLPYYFPHLHTLCFCTIPSPPLLVVLLSCHITSHTSTPCASAPCHPHLFLWFCCPAILLPTPPHPVLLHHAIPTSSCGSAVLPYYFPHLHTLCFCTPSPPLLVVLLSCHITSHTSTPCA